MFTTPKNTISLFQLQRPLLGEVSPPRTSNWEDPTEFDPADPIKLWIIQLGVIIVVTQVLALALRKIHQPKVIAEVLGGILLGPTALGRIPGFTQHVFPEESRSYLALTANIGLCLFLFLVGLEIDASVVKRNARLSASVALAGMALPFVLGSILAIPIFYQFIKPIDETIQFVHFMLFTSVAFSITAFPVLARILTELKLLDTTVGIVVLSAGVGNDIVGWVLLALSVALVNAGSSLSALYILITCILWTLFLLFPIKTLITSFAHSTGSIENGPSLSFLTMTFLVLFGSALFTDVIGVHAIFGAFVAGVIIPHDGGLAIALTEKLEDMVSIVFLPLYFTLSGLSTDLGLLDDGTTWAYTAAICILAFVGKFGGCTLAARYAAGFSWRESSAVGSLMSCKGLIELIVLNVALRAGILSQRVFSMFVLEAMLLTFMTTPLVTMLYPPAARTHANVGHIYLPDDESAEERSITYEGKRKFSTSFTVVLDRIEHVPAMMALTQILVPPCKTANNTSQTSFSSAQPPPIEALRLIELSDRTSTVMKSSASESLLSTDPLLSIYSMFGRLNDIEVRPSLQIVPRKILAKVVAGFANDNGSDMIFIPWLPGTIAPEEKETTSFVDEDQEASSLIDVPRHNGMHQSTSTRPASALHSDFVRSVFANASVDVALFVDQSSPAHIPSLSGKSHHLFLPFFGGPDDRLALEFVIHACRLNPNVTATIVRYVKSDEEAPRAPLSPTQPRREEKKESLHPGVNQFLTIDSSVGFPDTVYPHVNPNVMRQSESADTLIWTQFSTDVRMVPPKRTTSTTSSSSAGSSSSASTRSVSAVFQPITQYEFFEVTTPEPLHALVDRFDQLKEASGVRTLVVTGRSKRLAVEDHQYELQALIEERGQALGPEVRKTIGDVATACVLSAPSSCGVIVMQAGDVSVA